MEIDVVIIGAGVVGAAVARRLAADGKSVLVLEKFERVGEGVTSRNSGVIHSGIYYPPKSLKARLCVRGKELLYEWARAHEVPHSALGKAIVATTADEEVELANIHRNAVESGATGLTWWSEAELRKRLPLARGTSAVFAGETGIIDPFALTRSFLDDAEGNGAMVLTHAEVTSIEPASGGYRLETSRGPVQAVVVVNAAGLACDEIARLAGIDKYKIYPCRGDYFRLRSPQKYEHLVYPVKSKNDTGLGIHLTIDMSGSYKLGPDTEYVEGKCDFSPREEKREKFRKAAEKLLGPIAPEQLVYDQCGLRPKLRAPHEGAEKDFVIACDLPGFVNLIGIESPGLTSSMAIADEVAKFL